MIDLYVDPEWPDTYSVSERTDQPNWAWLDLWERENPRPEDQEDYRYWYSERQKVHDRIWVAWCFPRFQVWDWNEEDVALARKLVSGHVCSVCGRPDDSGCVRGC